MAYPKEGPFWLLHSDMKHLIAAMLKAPIATLSSDSSIDFPAQGDSVATVQTNIDSLEEIDASASY